jgi:hypothetical protein
MRNLSRLSLLVALVLLAGAAQAQTVRWTYVEGGWTTLDPDRGSRENGWFVGGAFDLGKVPIHLFGEYNDIDRLDIWKVGGGWHGLLGERADLFADGAFYDADYEDGFQVRFGARWMVAERFELNGYLSWVDLDFGDNKSAAVNGIFNFAKSLGVGGGFEWGDEFSTARAFVRFTFGPTR